MLSSTRSPALTCSACFGQLPSGSRRSTSAPMKTSAAREFPGRSGWWRRPARCPTSRTGCWATGFLRPARGQSGLAAGPRSPRRSPPSRARGSCGWPKDGERRPARSPANMCCSGHPNGFLPPTPGGPATCRAQCSPAPSPLAPRPRAARFHDRRGSRPGTHQGTYRRVASRLNSCSHATDAGLPKPQPSSYAVPPQEPPERRQRRLGHVVFDALRVLFRCLLWDA